METETLSSYEQPQDNHVLDESMDVNLTRDDEENESLESRDNSEMNSVIQHKEIINDDTGGLKEVGRCQSSENKENENDCDQSLVNSEEDLFLGNKLDSDNYNESEQLGEEKEVIESEDTNKNSGESCEQNTDNLKKVNNYDEDDPFGSGNKGPLNDKENDEDRDSIDSEKESLNNDEKLILSDEDKDLFSDDEILNDEEKDPLDDSDGKMEEVILNDEENDPLNENKKSDDPLGAENQAVDNPDNDEKSQKDDDPLSEEVQKDKDPLSEEKPKDNELPSEEMQKDVLCNNDENEQNNSLPQDKRTNKDPPDDKETANEADKMKNVQVCNDVGNEKEIVSCIDEKNENEKHLQEDKDNESDKNKESGDTAVETNENKPNEESNKESSEEKTHDKNEDVIKDCPLLKETLTKVNKNDGEQQKEGDNEMDMDMDDDFDPSLLCPDIAMEVDEAPVITTNDNVPNDGNKSPLLYEPFFSTYVDEMTGAEVSFNLTPEEQHLRQQTFGQDNPVQYTKIHCTACNVHLGSALDGQSNRFVHPLLKVLICKDCYHFYTSGEFEKDEDGSELYCRWCGQGGQVMCCSGCEMVFCKKCVRINFGRKKLAEIRDSDDWFCFRCNPSQLISLRVHCAEFMEYVRREISRAATLENATTFTTTDFTQCCLSQKKKYTEPHPNEPKKKKRKTSVDPDYDPYREREQDSPQPSTSGVKPPTTEANSAPPKPIPILPKPMDPAQNAGVVTQVTTAANLFKVGNTTFRPRTTYSQPRPRVQPVNAVTAGNVVRPSPGPSVRPSSGPGYIKIMPGGIRVTPTTNRNHPAQTFVSSSVRPQPPFQQRLPRPMGNANNQMKHEWFEKTVRAAARVNSNLSYTLTQLNRAQATATSVEALAVVHNKLQEILSTSINSLIQIRKNLRTEFIAGIKNIRFPSNKPPQPQPPPSTSTSAQDDDVIFVSPTPSPVPPPVLTPISTVPPLTSLQLPPSVSFTKRPPPSQGPSTSSDPIPSTSMEKPKMFLRVKSLTALQNVPSECITIPDDPLPPPPPLSFIQQNQDVTIIDDHPEKNGGGIIIKDVTSLVETDPLQVNTDEKLHNNTQEELHNNVTEKLQNISIQNDNSAVNIMNGKTDPIPTKIVQGKIENINDFKVSYNLKDHPSPEMKKMLSPKVYLKRSEEIDALVRSTFGLVNGNASK